MTAPGVGRVPVLVAAAGEPWETEALDLLDRAAPAVVLTKRCVDLTDLLATAGAGTASVAVVSPRLPGLDTDSVDVLHRAGMGVVVVATPRDLADGDGDRMRRLGIDHQLASGELAELVDTITSADAVGTTTTTSGTGTGTGTTPSPEEPAAGSPAPGRVVAVWGPAGAPGRTTVATGLAGEIAHAGHECLLLDLDPYGGAVAQHLGVLDEISGLLAAARAANTGQLDDERLAACARRVGDRLLVLTGLPRADRWQEVRPAAFDDLLSRASGLAPYVVADVGFSLEPDPVDPFGGTAPQRNLMTLTSLERADEVVVVGAADPVGLARLARGLVDLADLLPGVRPRVVVNRTRATLGWSDDEIHGMVEGFVRPLGVHFVPDDRVAADRALMAGRTLAESGDSSLRTAVAALASGLLGESRRTHARARTGRRPGRRLGRRLGRQQGRQRGR